VVSSLFLVLLSIRWGLNVGNVVFYNHYGNGDLFISREFIRDIMSIIPADNYYYAHAKNPRMFADIPKLQHTKITDNCIMRSRCGLSGSDIYINTWLGVDSTFVTRANSCSILNAYKMFSLILATLGYKPLSKPLDAYLPSVDYTAFDITPVDEFLKSVTSKLVLVANCNAQSGQAENFDMTSVIQRLCDNYHNTIFMVTDPVKVDAPNYITTGEITKSKDGFDLNEISYLSRFADLFIGRSSGAQIFTMTRDNYMNPDKTFLSFTKMVESAHIVWQAPVIKAKVYWSNATNETDVYNYTCKVINERRGNE